MWCGGSLEERVLSKRRGVGVRGMLVQEGEGAGKPVVGVWGGWRRGGVRGAEGGGRACWERRVRWVRRRRGRGFRLTLLSAEQKASGEVCEGERRWAGFYAGPQGAGQPLRMTAFCSSQVNKQRDRLASNEVGCVFLATTLLFHVLLLRTCPSDPGGSF